MSHKNPDFYVKLKSVKDFKDIILKIRKLDIGSNGPEQVDHES